MIKANIDLEKEKGEIKFTGKEEVVISEMMTLIFKMFIPQLSNENKKLSKYFCKLLREESKRYDRKKW